MVQNSYGGYSETPQTRSFRLFALLTSSTGVEWRYLGGVKVSRTHHDGNDVLFSNAPAPTLLFEGQTRAQNDGFGSKSSSRTS